MNVVMFTFGQLFVLAVITGVVGIGLGVLMAATYRSRPTSRVRAADLHDVFEESDRD
ncbi:hypothetical protein [Nonomuraea terrae]|uniref:hypothetical protein n=1 Tax=Nonomuraea terrae TaxID=2530383 RepID=UPI0014044515|nr:hypothetical protein [Nonomuraea terrae]